MGNERFDFRRFAPLNPCEAFVLGGLFLLHDAGLVLSAYPEQLDTIKEHPFWQDAVSVILRKRFDRLPTRNEVKHPGNDVIFEATLLTLREFHAERARVLPFLSFKMT